MKRPGRRPRYVIRKHSGLWWLSDTVDRTVGVHHSWKVAMDVADHLSRNDRQQELNRMLQRQRRIAQRVGGW